MREWFQIIRLWRVPAVTFPVWLAFAAGVWAQDAPKAPPVPWDTFPPAPVEGAGNAASEPQAQAEEQPFVDDPVFRFWEETAAEMDAAKSSKPSDAAVPAFAAPPVPGEEQATTDGASDVSGIPPFPFAADEAPAMPAPVALPEGEKAAATTASAGAEKKAVEGKVEEKATPPKPVKRKAKRKARRLKPFAQAPVPLARPESPFLPITRKPPAGASAMHDDGFFRPVDAHLLTAAKLGHVSGMRALLKKGARIEARDDHGNTAFMLAAASGKFQAARFLMNRKAKLSVRNEKGMTALHLAVHAGSRTLVGMLLHCGAYVDAQDDSGKTPLHHALEAQKYGVLSVLASNGAMLGLADGKGRAPLQYAARANDLQAMRILLKHGAEPDVFDFDGYTPLLYAALYGHRKMAVLLLDAGANPMQRDPFGRSAGELAARGGHRQVAGMLIAQGG